MSGPPKIRSMNITAESDVRSVLGPAGNKARLPAARKPASKLVREGEKPEDSLLSADKPTAGEAVAAVTPPPDAATTTPSPSFPAKKQPQQATASSGRASNVLRRHEFLLHSNLSLNASCSSEASTDSVCSRASTGRIISRVSTGIASRRKLGSRPKTGRPLTDSAETSGSSSPPPSVPFTKRCAWVTANTDPKYVAFHDEEWGVPVHDDKKLFELLCLSGALAELTWPSILSKRHLFREVFADFDPPLVAKLNEKRISAPGTSGSSLLSELRLHSIIENARQITKIVEEFGSFDSYCWSFVNQKPIVNRFRYPRQVPVKTSKAELISKDMVKRGFRSVGPTVVYTFMQVTGMTNDHLISCYRFDECLAAEGATESRKTETPDGEKMLEVGKLDLSKSMAELSMSSLTMKTDSSDLVGVMLA
ncbi:uncharacterized protein LOC116250585 [Nymphaea colorata]|nr:uncharacterized protein LOC116250585 [Nymphaea colorata]